MRTTTRGFRRCWLGCKALSIWFNLPTWTSCSILGLQKAGFGRAEHLQGGDHGRVRSCQGGHTAARALQRTRTMRSQADAALPRLESCDRHCLQSWAPLKAQARAAASFLHPPDISGRSPKNVVPYIESDKNLADFFTKPLSARKFFELRRAIMNEANEF